MDSIYRRLGNDPFFPSCFGAAVEIGPFSLAFVLPSRFVCCNCVGNFLSLSLSLSLSLWSSICLSFVFLSYLLLRLFWVATGKLQKKKGKCHSCAMLNDFRLVSENQPPGFVLFSASS